MKKVFMLTILGVMFGTMSIAVAGQGERQGGQMGGMAGKGQMGSSGEGMMMKEMHGSGDMMPMMQQMHGMTGKMTGMMDKTMNKDMDRKQMMDMSDMMDKMSDHMKDMCKTMREGDFSEKRMEKLKNDMMETEKRMDQMMK
jgi:hypothetical protein